MRSESSSGPLYRHGDLYGGAGRNRIADARVAGALKEDSMGWVNGGNSQVLAVHAALLHTNEILYFSGDEHDRGQHAANLIDHSRLINCTTLLVTVIGSPTSDVFCSGHAGLPDGRLLVAGGTSAFPHEGEHGHESFAGRREAWTFDPVTRTWVQVADMLPQPGLSTGGGRWYPTLLTLPSGRVLAVSGIPHQDDTRPMNNAPETFASTPSPAGVWRYVGPDDPVHTVSHYPRLHVLPGGEVFCSTPVGVTPRTRRFRPWTATWADLTNPPVDPDNTTSVLLPLLPEDHYQPRVLLCGATQPVRIELGAAALTWQPTGPRVIPGAATRRHQNAVILPTGDVFVCGGVGAPFLDANAVLTPELYQSQTNTWTTLPAALVRRNYHSVALLMPDGRVFTAGSNEDGKESFQPPGTGADNRELDIELFEPAYFAVSRPQITTAPAAVRCAQPFDVDTPQAGSIGRVAVLQAGSVTHSLNDDQRYVGLRFTQTDSGRLRVLAPPNATIAPPGYYLLVVTTHASVPSAGRFIRIDAPPRRPLVTGPGPGGGPHVRIFKLDEATGLIGGLGGGFFAYDPLFTGGVHVAAGDVDGDGHVEVITGAGAGGGPHVRVWKVDGTTGAATALGGGFLAYDPLFTGGVHVAAGDVDGDGRVEVITGAGAGGGPHVRVWKVDGTTGAATALGGGFLAYDPLFTGGVHVAAGDIDGDGRVEVITGAGAGGGPHVRVWKVDGTTGAATALGGGFLAYDPLFTGGVHVAAGDVDGDGRVEVITGAGAGGGPHVRVWKVDGTTGAATEWTGFLAYSAGFTGGVRVAAVDADGDGVAELITGPGPGGGPHTRVFKAASGAVSELTSFFAYSVGFAGGVAVG